MEKYDKGKCSCTFCKNYRRYKWAKIKECPCSCHTDSEPAGHDSLCCEFPNGRKKDIPYKHLNSAKYYKKIIDKWRRECED